MFPDDALRTVTRTLAHGGLQDADELTDRCGLDEPQLLDALALATEHGYARLVPGRPDAWCATFRGQRLVAAA